MGNVGKSQSPCWWDHHASVVHKVNNDLTNVRKPSAVVLSRIQRLRDMDFVNSVEEYLHRNNIDEVWERNLGMTCPLKCMDHPFKFDDQVPSNSFQTSKNLQDFGVEIRTDS